VLGRRISVVVPFWMRDDEAGRDALRLAEGSISGVTVMAYRTEIAEIEQLAAAWLDWGAERGLSVRIALENGPLPVEVHQTFVRAEKGRLAIDTAGQPHVVKIFAAAISDSYTRPVYAFSHETETPPSRVSFMGDLPALTRVRSRLARNLSAWASYGGLAVHALIFPGG
jgi:hypothetical protein